MSYSLEVMRTAREPSLDLAAVFDTHEWHELVHQLAKAGAAVAADLRNYWRKLSKTNRALRRCRKSNLDQETRVFLRALSTRRRGNEENPGALVTTRPHVARGPNYRRLIRPNQSPAGSVPV